MHRVQGMLRHVPAAPTEWVWGEPVEDSAPPHSPLPRPPPSPQPQHQALPQALGGWPQAAAAPGSQHVVQQQPPPHHQHPDPHQEEQPSAPADWQRAQQQPPVQQQPQASESWPAAAVAAGNQQRPQAQNQALSNAGPFMELQPERWPAAAAAATTRQQRHELPNQAPADWADVPPFVPPAGSQQLPQQPQGSSQTQSGWVDAQAFVPQQEERAPDAFPPAGSQRRAPRRRTPSSWIDAPPFVPSRGPQQQETAYQSPIGWAATSASGDVRQPPAGRHAPDQAQGSWPRDAPPAPNAWPGAYPCPGSWEQHSAEPASPEGGVWIAQGGQTGRPYANPSLSGGSSGEPDISAQDGSRAAPRGMGRPSQGWGVSSGLPGDAEQPPRAYDEQRGSDVGHRRDGSVPPGFAEQLAHSAGERDRAGGGHSGLGDRTGGRVGWGDSVAEDIFWGGPGKPEGRQDAGLSRTPPGKGERVRVGFQPYCAPPVFAERRPAAVRPRAQVDRVSNHV